jgi:hypothetical protein
MFWNIWLDLWTLALLHYSYETPEYTEGPKALENFERFATAMMQPRKPTRKGSERINLMLSRGNQNLPDKH